MRAPLTLTLPLPPNLANARMHWRTKQSLREFWFASCDTLQALKRLPPPPTEPMTGVVATAVLDVAREHDDDNAMHRAYKWPLDWLKTRGYIVDDKRKHVRCQVPEQNVKRRPHYYVTITLTPIVK